MKCALQSTDTFYMESNDKGLIRSVMHGNPDAYMSLVERYLDVVSRTAFRILCDREDSEAVTVKVFESLWYDVLDYDDRTSLRVWLLHRAWIFCRLRIMKRRVLRVMGISSDMFVRAAPKVDDHDDYIVKQAWEVLCRASAHMTPLQRAVYALAVLEGLDPAEVAEITGFTHFRVTLALQRAETKVRDELLHFEKDDVYEKYTSFLKRVSDGMTDREHLAVYIISQLDI